MDAELPTVHRNVVRLVVLDIEERVLLLHVRDLGNPAFGTAWELPGGGIEADESDVDAAVRELREETGLEVKPTWISPATWRRDVRYSYRGVRWQQQEVVAAVRLNEATPLIQDSHRFEFEKEDVLSARWWSMQQIATSSELFYPRSLPTLLPSFLRGEIIEEPLEVWP
jgi:8-oxo-dGTP pyrophosphatase MutT (NUDIX family)